MDIIRANTYLSVFQINFAQLPLENVVEMRHLDLNTTYNILPLVKKFRVGPSELKR